MPICLRHRRRKKTPAHKKLSALSLAFVTGKVILGRFYYGLAIYLWSPGICVALPWQTRQTYVQDGLYNFAFQERQP